MADTGLRFVCAQMEAMTEKVSRMKALLIKSKELNQEREAEVTKLADASGSGGARPRRFTIQARLALPTHPGAPETTSWCLICEDAPPARPHRAQSPSLPSLPPLGPPPGLRWAAEEAIQQWVEEGSSVVGDWPETLQDAFGRQLAQVRLWPAWKCLSLGAGA